jgi:hypothetical protein
MVKPLLKMAIEDLTRERALPARTPAVARGLQQRMAALQTLLKALPGAEDSSVPLEALFDVNVDKVAVAFGRTGGAPLRSVCFTGGALHCTTARVVVQTTAVTYLSRFPDTVLPNAAATWVGPEIFRSPPCPTRRFGPRSWLRWSTSAADFTQGVPGAYALTAVPRNFRAQHVQAWDPGIRYIIAGRSVCRAQWGALPGAGRGKEPAGAPRV